MSRKQTTMLRVMIAEYQNYVTPEKFPRGHGKKALEEAYQLVNLKPFQVKCVASPAYCDFQVNDVKYIDEIVRDQRHKLIRLFRIFKNLRCIFREGKNEIIWFTNVDWMFFVYVALFTPRTQKIAITIFRNILEDATNPKWGICKGLLSYLVSNGMAKIDLMFVTNPTLSISGAKQQIHIPDYFYKNVYSLYRNTAKAERIVCLGLMNVQKELKKLVRHFSNTEIEVWIIGLFDNEDYYNAIRKLSGSNIKIENRALSEKEYLNIIGGSQFVILPYAATEYKEATSGILLETIFMNSIPVAPKFLLKNNGKTIHNSIAEYQFDHIQHCVTNAFIKITDQKNISKSSLRDL